MKMTGGIREENRRLSARLADAGAEDEQIEVDLEESEEDFEEESPACPPESSHEVAQKAGFQRSKTYKGRRNPFEFRQGKDSNMDAKLDTILAKLNGVATKQDVGAIHRRVVKVEEGQDSIRKELRSTLKRVERLEVKAREEVGRKKQLPDASTSEDELTTKQLSYLTARKSLIIGPVEPTEVEVRMFFLTKMQMDQEMAEEVAIVDIKSIMTGRSRLTGEELKKQSKGR